MAQKPKQFAHLPSHRCEVGDNGKPVVRGTRITAPTVLEFLAAGDSMEDVLEEYPSLTREDVQACLDYASKLMGNHYSVVQ